MRGCVAAILLICLAAPASVAFGQDAVPAIAAQRDRCRQVDPYPPPIDLQQCDVDAIRRAGALTSESDGTAALDAWLVDLFDPLQHALTGGEDALAARVAVTSSQADFALLRAAILTHDDPTAVAGDTATVNPFEPLREYADPDALHRRWVAVRTADCVAYPVSDCAARLDEALEHMIESLLSDE